MPLTLTIAALREHRACALEMRVNDLERALGRSAAPNERIPLRTWWALPSTSAWDRVWSLRCVEPQNTARAIAWEVAQRAVARATATVCGAAPDLFAKNTAACLRAAEMQLVYGNYFGACVEAVTAVGFSASTRDDALAALACDLNELIEAAEVR